jgi:hypothetical protein
MSPHPMLATVRLLDPLPPHLAPRAAVAVTLSPLAGELAPSLPLTRAASSQDDDGSPVATFLEGHTDFRCCAPAAARWREPVRWGGGGGRVCRHPSRPLGDDAGAGLFCFFIFRFLAHCLV